MPNSKEPYHDIVTRKPKQPLCKINSWPSFSRSSEQIVKQEYVRATPTHSVTSNHQPVVKTRRKRSRRRKHVPQMKSIYFSTRGQSSEDASEVLAKARLERKNLAHIKSNLQTDLKVIEQRIAKSRFILLDLHNDFVTQIATLTKYQTELVGFKKDLLDFVRLKLENAAKVHDRLTRFESQRKSLMAKMTNPQWNKQHCFYMLALERFREKKQVKQIIEIAEAMSGNIAITAVAHHSIQQHKKALAKYQSLVVDRSLLEEKHSMVAKKLQICSFRISEYESLLLAMKKKISRKDKEKIRKAERIAAADGSQSPKSFTKPATLRWRYKQRHLGNAATAVEEYDEDENSFWNNVDVQEFIRFLDELFNEMEEKYSFTKMDATTNKLFQGFQDDHLHRSLEGYQVSQCSDDSRAYSSSGSIPGLGSSIVTTPDPKIVNCFLTPTSPGSNCTSLSEMEFPPTFYSMGGITVEAIPSLAGDGRLTKDYNEGSSVDLKALNDVLETMSTARSDHKACSSNLKMTNRRIEELDIDISRYVSENEISVNKARSKAVCAVDLTEQKNVGVSSPVQVSTNICREEN